MPVGNFTEMLFTTLGWQLYEIIWNSLVVTGLVYLPLFAVMYRSIVIPLESQAAKNNMKEIVRTK